MTDREYLEMALENSQKSMDAGNFPAGAIVVKNNEVLSSAVSSPFPGLFHADSKAVTKAFEKHGPLTGATLYIGLESCLMCLNVAYWAGIRRIVYAVPKRNVNAAYYESSINTEEVLNKLHEPIEVIHLAELEEKALLIVKDWEKKYAA